uniref:Uncharacterized protein n=1 Tax=Romanomermis culicivorax TaxID=13658 RepID=A0A915HPK7_ROMCU
MKKERQKTKMNNQVDAFPFENCADIAATGNCSSIVGDGAIGAQSINSIALYAAQGNLGPGAGCPFQAGACSNGFSYYGWLKFFSYVTPCENYGVVVNHFAPIQIDRSFWDGTFKNVQDLIAWLTDVSARQGVCMGKPYSTLTNLMHCYWVVQSPTKNWNDAFTACGSSIL